METAVPVLTGVLLLLFSGFVLLRLLRSVRRGLSIRMQVFVAMTAVSGGFAALLGVIAVQRLELRAARLFTEVAKEHAALLGRVLAATDRACSKSGPRACGSRSAMAPAGSCTPPDPSAASGCRRRCRCGRSVTAR
jgi:hypothetical protein